MTPIPLEKETILVRIDGIQQELAELYALAGVSFEDFAGTPFKLGQYHLHRALEGVFHIAAHILSRIPGGSGGGSYKEMARLMGEKGIVEREFAQEKLQRMAGYRNRLVHFYAEITAEELHGVLKNNLGDIETFLQAVRSVLASPEKYGLLVSGT